MFAVIYVEDFSLQAALRAEPSAASRAVALIEANSPKSLIIQCTQAARDAGVSEGMSATQALARCPALLLKSRSRAQEKSANEALLRCAFCFSPDIESTSEGVVTLDLKGFKDLPVEQYAREMIAQVALLHLSVRVGIGENPLLAFYAARKAQPFLRITNSREFLGTLPIETIEPSPEVLTVLKKWGIQTLGSLLALGKKDVAERLGAEALALFERAAGNADRPLRLVRPAEGFEESVEFENEIETIEPLLFVLRRYIEQITVQMEMAGLMAEEMTLRLRFSDGSSYEHAFKVPAPTRDHNVLFRMLHTHLEDLRTEHSIVGLHLSGKPCPGKSRQFGLFDIALRDSNRFGETIARLSALVGSDRVGTPVILPTYRPDAFEMRSPNFERDLSLDAVGAPPDTGLRNHVGLPLRRFRPPRPVQVELSGARPVYLKAAGFGSGIQATRGPWRSSGDWWDIEIGAATSGMCKLRTGGFAGLFEEDGHWFMDGIYD